MPSVVIYEGSVYYDPHAEMEFEVIEAPKAGSSEHAPVVVEYEDGQRLTRPYDHFGGYHDTYELVKKGDQRPSANYFEPPA